MARNSLAAGFRPATACGEEGRLESAFDCPELGLAGWLGVGRLETIFEWPLDQLETSEQGWQDDWEGESWECCLHGHLGRQEGCKENLEVATTCGENPRSCASVYKKAIAPVEMAASSGRWKFRPQSANLGLLFRSGERGL